MKRILSFILALTLLAGNLPVGTVHAHAAEVETLPAETVAAEETVVPETIATEPEEQTEETVPEASDSLEPDNAMAWAEDFEDVGIVRSVADAANRVREYMVRREPGVVFQIQSDSPGEDIYEQIRALVFAYESTGIECGDYLEKHTKSCGAGWETDSWASGYLNFAFDFTFYTTKEQEKRVAEEIATLREDLGLNSHDYSDYETVKIIYDWVCSNVTYDDAHKSDPTYDLKYTAYAALVDRTAVCQGYALLMYRLLREMDIDCRYVSGRTDEGSHGWNIVKLGDVYYNLDATFDAARVEAGLPYAYFLKCDASFSDHIRSNDHNTKEFYTAHPMSASDYTPKPSDFTQPEEPEVTEPVPTEPEVTEPEVTEPAPTEPTPSEPAVPEDGPMSWKITADGTLIISGSGPIPNYNAGGAPWYAQRESIKKLVISEAITGIGNNAFRNLTNLASAKIPEAVTTVGMYAFNGCSSLESIVVPNINIVGTNAFNGCPKLISAGPIGGDYNMQFGISGTTVKEKAFSFCLTLQTIVLPEGITTLGISAFEDHTALVKIVIPETVTRFWSSTFHGCRNLTTVNIPKGLTELPGHAFNGCSSLKNIELPEGLTSIDTSVFYNCSSLENINIPDSVTTIEMWAFQGCSALKEITIPEGVTEIEQMLFYGCSSLEKVTLHDGIHTIDTWVFSNCTSLSEIILPKYISEIPMGTFAECNSLQKINIPEGVTHIGEHAFVRCTNLKEISLPETLTNIDNSAFYGCNALTEIIIPKSVTTIGTDAFHSCFDLKEIYCYSDDVEFGENALSHATTIYCYQGTVLSFIGSNIPAHIICPAPIGAEMGHDYSKVTVHEPACNAPGYTEHTCVRCEHTYQDSYIEVPHNFGDWVVTRASCYGNGSEKRTCADCGHYETRSVPKTGHIYGEWTVIQEPTCTGSGTERRTCTGFNCTYSETRYPNSLGHDYVEDSVTEPTCTSRGYTSYKCNRCGKTYSDNYVDMLPHSYGDWVLTTAPGCYSSGTETRTCTGCSNTATRRVPAVGHIYGEWTVTREPTCTGTGMEKRTCTGFNCTSYETRYLEALDHNYEKDSVTEPTCTAQGYTTYKCSRCAVTKLDDHVAALGHKYGDWTVTREPTCTYQGREQRECTACGNKETRYPEALGHSYSDTIIPPTCTSQGYTKHSCDTCGNVKNDTYVDALGHDYVKDSVKEAGCYYQGYTTYKCSRCAGTKQDDHVAALGHKYGDWTVTREPTCTYQGREQRECTRCGNTEIRYPEALGHSYASTVTPPTCIAEGYTTHKCSRCNNSYSNTKVPAKGHTEVVDKAEAATCTAAGKTEGKHCSICNTVLVKQETIPAKDHIWDSGKVTKEPTESAEGVKTFNCTVCEATKTEKIAVLGHTHKYSETVTAPTCTKKGYATFTCACGHSYQSKETPAKGHTEVIDKAVTATCTAAGKTEGKHCSVCNTVLVKQETVPAKGHTEIIDKAVAPTCTVAGKTEGKHCSVCNAVLVKQEAVAAWGHNEVIDKAEAATCTAAGKTEGKHCSVCNTVLVKQETIPAKDHIWDSGKVTKEPTETTEGVKTFTCTACPQTKTESIPVLGHSHKYTETVTAPTCTAKGYTTFTCACGHSYQGKETPAKGHTEVIDKAEAATCTAAGKTEGKHCSVCNTVLVKQETIPAKDHIWDSGKVTKEPTETTEGVKTFTCTACPQTKTESIPVLGHSHKYTETITAPTCTAKGYTTFTCVCGHSYQGKETPANGHTEVIDKAEAATCTAAGKTEGKHCSVCNTVLVKQEIVPAKDHIWDSGKVTKEPSETAEGVKTFTCTVCEETRTESIPKLPAVDVTEPTEPGPTEPEPTEPEPTEPEIPADPEDPETVERISGNGRVQTALASAELLKKLYGIEKFQTIVVADARNFPDALSGSYLAAAAKAPILLYVDKQNIVIDYINANLADGGTVYILGGQNSVPSSLTSGLNAGTHVIRLAGSGRWATSLLIIQEADRILGHKPNKVLICTGMEFADSLSASATGLPILLVNGKNKELTQEQKNYLSSLENPDLYVVGGENSVSKEILEQLHAYDVDAAERISGSGREKTSAALANYFFFRNNKNVVLANSRDFPDGLSGGPVAFALGSPLLLICNGREGAATDFVASKGIEKGYVIGGKTSVSAGSTAAVFGK